jgi:hypothetical protein
MSSGGTPSIGPFSQASGAGAAGLSSVIESFLQISLQYQRVIVLGISRGVRQRGVARAQADEEDALRPCHSPEAATESPACGTRRRGKDAEAHDIHAEGKIAVPEGNDRRRD